MSKIFILLTEFGQEQLTLGNLNQNDENYDTLLVKFIAQYDGCDNDIKSISEFYYKNESSINKVVYK